MPQPIYLKRRPFPVRMWKSYFSWRAWLGPWAALKAAYRVATA